MIDFLMVLFQPEVKELVHPVQLAQMQMNKMTIILELVLEHLKYLEPLQLVSQLLRESMRKALMSFPVTNGNGKKQRAAEDLHCVILEEQGYLLRVVCHQIAINYNLYKMEELS